jgi:hypothetical protein
MSLGITVVSLVLIENHPFSDELIIIVTNTPTGLLLTLVLFCSCYFNMYFPNKIYLLRKYTMSGNSVVLNTSIIIKYVFFLKYTVHT